MDAPVTNGNQTYPPVRLTVDMSYGSYQFLRKAIENHNEGVVERHGRRHPKLRFTSLVRSLTGSWMRDKI